MKPRLLPLRAPAPAAPIAEILALAPAVLVQQLAGLGADLELAYAPNTLRAWDVGWRAWVAFCAPFDQIRLGPCCP
jgi:hypothetical protein